MLSVYTRTHVCMCNAAAGISGVDNLDNSNIGIGITGIWVYNVYLGIGILSGRLDTFLF